MPSVNLGHKQYGVEKVQKHIIKEIALPLITEPDKSTITSAGVGVVKNDSRILKQDVSNPRFFKENNAFRFSLYTDRKDMQLNESNPIISYLEPIDHTKGVKSINFEKMKDRPLHGMAIVNNVPTICYYKPNYDSVLKSSPRALKFNNEKVDFSKQYLVKKMWKSYDVTSDYKLVQLKTIVEKQV